MNDETKLKNKCRAWLSREYPKALMIKLSDKFISGIPDAFILCNERILFIEFKTPKGKVSRIQANVFNQFASRGHEVKIVRCPAEFAICVLSFLNKCVSIY